MITVNFNRVFVENNIALGNHMFQYAVCRLVATKNNYNFFISYGDYISKCFPGIDLGVNDGKSKYTWIDDNMSQAYRSDIFNIPDFTDLHGFYQTDKYFQGNEELVKSWFPIDINDDSFSGTPTVKSIAELFPVDDFCYMHIRGGDAKNDANWLMPRKYYSDAMAEVRKIKPDISFVIITDDIELSREYFPEITAIGYDDSIDSISALMIDFRSLYNSKYCIISSSTFSWWASWLSDKIITVAPNNWLNYNKPTGSGFYPVDIKVDKFTYV